MHSYFQISPKTFGGVQVWALAELLKDIHRVVQKPLLSCLGFLLKFFGLLEDEPLLQSKDHRALEQVNINDDFVHCCIYLSLDLDKSPSSHNIILPPPCFIVGIVLPSCAWFPPDITLSIQAKEFNPCFIRPQILFLRLWESFGCLLANCLLAGCHVLFPEEWLPSGHYQTGLMAGVLQK